METAFPRSIDSLNRPNSSEWPCQGLSYAQEVNAVQGPLMFAQRYFSSRVPVRYPKNIENTLENTLENAGKIPERTSQDSDHQWPHDP